MRDDLLADKGSIIHEMVLHTADENYIVARWCFDNQRMDRLLLELGPCAGKISEGGAAGRLAPFSVIEKAKMKAKKLSRNEMICCSATYGASK